MDLAVLKVDPAEAREKLAEYTKAVAAERTAQDEALAQAYRAAARGLPIIRLSEAVQRGGFFTDGLPRIAVVRADATDCWVEHNRRFGGHTYVYSCDRRVQDRGALVGAKVLRVKCAGPKAWDPNARAGHTIVPMVPPAHRPKRHRLGRCHLLWEVERWDPTPPVDPALIKHLRGDLWVVLDVWDLTELERAVLAGR
jgi:hypothetical protein